MKKDELLNKQNGKCAICGAENTDLVFEHIIPISAGGTDSNENLILICKHHNVQFGNRRFREFEFTNYLVRLLQSNKKYQNVSQEVLLDNKTRYRADIIVEEKTEKSKNKKLLIEVKSFSSFTKSRIRQIIHQINSYYSIIEDDVRKVFAFPGIISIEDQQIFLKHEIEVWDLKFINENFKNEISTSNDMKFLQFYGITGEKDDLSKEEKLITELKSIKPGRDDWSKYQKHIGKILDYLFGDSLSSPIVESADEFGVNRRDFILRNYSDKGFWRYLRDRYAADFIVVDAKNYTKEVKKKEVLQISNYLKEQGTGLFAMIISRNGEKKNSYMTRRDKWMLDNKLVIVLTDDDIEQMILAKASSNDPEEIIKQRIEEFRLKI